MLAVAAALAGLLPAPAHNHPPGEYGPPVYQLPEGCSEQTFAAPFIDTAVRVAGAPCPACAAGPAPALSLPVRAEATLTAPSTPASLAIPDAPPPGARPSLALVRGPPASLPS